MREFGIDKGGIKNIHLIRSLTDIAEDDGEEDESVGGADEDDAQVHPEVEDLEDLRLGERQHHDPAELGQRDARQNLQKHIFPAYVLISNQNRLIYILFDPGASYARHDPYFKCFLLHIRHIAEGRDDKGCTFYTRCDV